MTVPSNPTSGPTSGPASGRLAAVAELRASIGAGDAALDGLVELAVDLAGTSMAAITLLDEQGEWLISRRGLADTCFELELALCAHVVLHSAPLVVEDMRSDPRFSQHPLVIGAPGLCFYAGYPLRCREGTILGAFCVLDTRPRRLSAELGRRLERLAAQAVALLEQRREIRSLSQFGQRYQSALDNAQVGVWEVSGLDQAESWCSPQLYRMLGFDPDAAPGLPALLDAIHPEDLQYALDILSELPQSGALLTTILRLRMQDGSYRWCSARGQTVYDPERGLLKRLGTLIDIDEQRRAEQTLERFHTYQQRLHQLAYELGLSQDELLQQSIAVLCACLELPAGSITRVQGGVYEVLAVIEPAAQQAAQPVMPHQKFPIGNSFIGHIYDQGAIGSLDELTRLNPERCDLIRSYGIETLIGAPYGVKGEPYGVVTCYGYTPRPQGFNALERDFLGEFSLWLGLMLERNHYLDSLHKLNLSKHRLLAVVAHDLRNPLATILSAKRRLERGLGQGPAVEARMLEVIERSSRSAIQLIEELLEAGELEQEQVNLPLEPVNLSRFAREVLAQFEPRAEAAQLRLSLQGDQQDLSVALNPRGMARVLENLLHNALKFTPAGGEISLTLSLAPPHASLTIADTGIGIPPELLAQLFDKYGAARRQGLRGELSNGLGMHIVQEIVAQHDGQLRVSSEVGRGTRFELSLPLVQPIRPKLDARPDAR